MQAGAINAVRAGASSLIKPSWRDGSVNLYSTLSESRTAPGWVGPFGQAYPKNFHSAFSAPSRGTKGKNTDFVKHPQRTKLYARRVAVMRSIDRLAVAFLIIAIVSASAAFAAFSFFDPIQAAFYAHLPRIIGVPVEWQFNFQHPFSELARHLYRFHNFLLGINIAICALVTGLVMVAVWLYRASRHPEPECLVCAAARTPLEWPVLTQRESLVGDFVCGGWLLWARVKPKDNRIGPT
jgi:hypothetical protein